MPTPLSFFRALPFAIALAAAFPATGLAQYLWLDERGVKQFSDRPPPTDVPASRILKQPGRPAASPEPSADAAPAGDAPKGPPSTAERNADYKKRMTERQERERQTAEKDQFAQDMSRNCERARDYQRSLESGERISRLSSNGERIYLDEAQRSRESADNRRILDKCK
ncbi:DUF4124 domain-containing protein [Noviherbaspirillum galbum]|uniref:DUF4124 domain-containing protein n=1 Tax=Noviherbaspirillum galbum TaxID=2709383 RepID=A0A6B3SFS1_9BURK|nr:DUF4124 domain-containing protein [Noviherbaspirillum galbum]NEX59747.1 DUF4124 domain-containing protein [Noviherbaspirillum galbum]